MWLNLDQRFKTCGNTFWQFWIAYIYLSLSPAHRSKILSFFLYCLPWRYCGNGSEVVCFAFLFRFPFFLNFSNYWVLGGLFNPRTRLCSGNHQWLLAPNFCSQATRKSYFFHRNHMLGTLVCESTFFGSCFTHHPGFHRLKALHSFQFS